MEQLLMFECEACKKSFPISQEQAPNSLKHKREYQVNGQSIFLTYYDCPFCGKRHLVQIDDKSSLQELERVKIQFVKLAVAKQKGKAIPKKQQEQFKKSRQHLSSYRANLMKEFTGKIAYSMESGEAIELRFSV